MHTAFIRGGDHLEKLHSSLRRGFPTGTVMQWILFPDHNLNGFIGDYASCRDTKNPISLETIEQTATFIRDGAKNGVRKMGGIPIRNFRLFITLKSETVLSDASLSNLEQVLSSAGLAPRRLSADDLMRWSGEFFNGTKPNGRYDPDYELRKQIIKAETLIDFRNTPAKIGQRYATCLTPKTVPQGSNSPLRTNELFGGFMGSDEDMEQITAPFLYCLTIIYTDDIKNSTNTKADWTAKQGFVASVAHSLKARMQEFNSIQSSMAQDGTMAYYVPSLWVFGDTPRICKPVSVGQVPFGNGAISICSKNRSLPAPCLSPACHLASTTWNPTCTTCSATLSPSSRTLPGFCRCKGTFGAVVNRCCSTSGARGRRSALTCLISGPTRTISMW
ncbi:TraC family protein (plasmid) [Aeromonas media]|nr:TraC family protein [Aeromonas media]